MKIWARVVYIVTFGIVATVPFNPLLNKRFIVFPLSVICVILGLIAMYLCTLPGKPKGSGKGGAA
jgi:uncharacterized membrane protein